MTTVIGPDVFKFESFRKIEIALNCAQLPLAADCITYIDINFGPIERSIALFDRIVDTMSMKRFSQCRSCLLPDLVATHGFFWVTRGKFEFKILKTKLAQYRNDKIKQRSDLVGHLVFCAKNMTVILCKSANSQETVQSSSALVSIDGAKFKQTQRQFAITALPVAIDQAVHRTVHRLRVIRTVIHLHRWIHAVFIEVQVTRSFKQFCIGKMRRKHKLISAILMAVTAVVLHQFANDSALWMPHRESTAEF